MNRPERFVSQTFNAEAIRVTPSNIFETAAWCGGEVAGRDTDKPYVVLTRRKGRTVQVGEWILRLDDGGYRIYSDKLFRQVFLPKKTSSVKFEEVLRLVKDAMLKQDTATYMERPRSTEGYATEITEKILNLF